MPGPRDIDFLDHVWTANGTLGWVVGEEGRDLLSLGVGYANVKVSILDESATGDGIASFVGWERAIGESLTFRLRASMYDDFETVIGTAGFGFRF